MAQRFLARGERVLATTRTPERLAGTAIEIAELSELSNRLSPGALVLHSIPPEGPDVIPLLGRRPARLVYLSSTAVYGAAEFVDEATPVHPGSDRARARLEAERSLAGGPWSCLILRCAAIYGPGRGIHERVKRGERAFPRHIVSRIHVKDLAAICEAALMSDVTGAYPVADEEPASSWGVAEFSAKLLRLPGPADIAASSPRESGNRSVDGSAIRRVLGVTLRHPSYRTGIPAALAESAQGA